MPKEIRNRRLIRFSGSLLLLAVTFVLLWPVFNASAERTNPQDPKPSQQAEQGVIAPMERIKPVSVAVVSLKKLAAADETKAANSTDQTPAQVGIHPPLTVAEPTDVGAEPAPPAASSEIGPPLIVSPAPAANFVAQLDEFRVGTTSRFIPPDTTGAVGPSQIFSNLNSNYRVQDKVGATLLTVSVATFWSAVSTPSPGPSPAPSPVSGVFDPRVQYDPYNGRWLIAAASNGRSASASILVGVSATSDPQGTFTLFRFVVGCAAGAMGCDADGEWADFPMLGFNKNWVAVGWNQFDSASPSSSFVGGKMLILDYPSLRAGTVNSNISTVVTGANFCMHPAETYSSTEETLYVPAHFSSASATYRLHKIMGTPSAPVYTVDTVSKTRPGGGWAVPGGDILPQTCVGTPGTTCPTTLRAIDSADAHLRSNVVFRNGSIWYAQTIGLPASGLTHTAAQWTRIDTNGTFVDGGRVEDPSATATSGEWYAYSSIAVNANNDVLLGFSNFAGTHFANAGYAFHAGTDAAGTMRDPVIFKQGEDYYSKDFGGSRNRWGDYSHSVVDPTNDLDMWTIQEYAGTRVVQDSQTTTSNSRWGTWWAKVTDIGGPPPSATPTPSPTPTPTPIVAPPNDNFANAQTISGCAGTVPGTNIGATKEPGEPSHEPAGNPGSASVWYQWQAPASANVTITTIGSDFDTLLAVYTGNAVNGLTACPTCKNDDIDTNAGNLQSSVTFTATAGTVYKIAVDGWCCAGEETGNIVLNWNQTTCPAPGLVLEQGTSNLAAVDSVSFVRGPFALTDNFNFSSDHRTRITFFTTDLGFAQRMQPSIDVLSVQVGGNSFAVESVGPNATLSGSQIVFRLPDTLTPGTYALGIRVRGVNSTNSPNITIVTSPSSPESAAPSSSAVSAAPKRLTDLIYPLRKPFP